MSNATTATTATTAIVRLVESNHPDHEAYAIWDASDSFVIGYAARRSPAQPFSLNLGSGLDLMGTPTTLKDAVAYLLACHQEMGA